jgi:hypothetical protein
MVAHQIAEDAVERPELSERFKRLVGIGCEQSPQDRLVAFRMILSTQISDRIADDQRFPRKEVEEAIDDSSAVQQR